jgi:hypothetical protein
MEPFTISSSTKKKISMFVFSVLLMYIQFICLLTVYVDVYKQF